MYRSNEDEVAKRLGENLRPWKPEFEEANPHRIQVSKLYCERLNTELSDRC
jgi:hypothetical protein